MSSDFSDKEIEMTDAEIVEATQEYHFKVWADENGISLQHNKDWTYKVWKACRKDCVVIKTNECPYTEKLRHLASVSRTLTTACRVIDNSVFTSADFFGEVSIVLDELEHLTPALDWLHQAFKNEIQKDGDR